MKTATVFQFGWLVALSVARPQHDEHNFSVGQRVHTSSGVLIGRSASEKTAVSEYLGIPFAQPPVGDLRFAAPQPYVNSGLLNTTSFSPDCPANTQGGSSVPSGLAGSSAIRQLAALSQIGDKFSEDCLTLNIWTKPQSGETAKAVLFWIYGGGFQTGNTNNPAYDGQFLADGEDVVVVSANYRLNIFGFPGLPGMDQNLGLLDQRLAVEWVQKNIAAFGGDPERITIFGQSAGAASVDFYSYAWKSDPIVNGFIEESGTAADFGSRVSSNNTLAWFNATEKLNCGWANDGVPATVACMRTKSFEQILNATVLPPGLSAVTGQFGPTVDNKTVFGDYPQRAATGQFIQKPLFVGNNDYEAGLFKIVAEASNTTLPDTFWAIFDLASFTCPAADTALARSMHVPTYRYRYFGEFPNTRLTLNPSSGAWHGAEIGVIWQTAGNVSGVPNTPAETSISAYLSGAWATFAKNPDMGLSQRPYGWPRYEANEATLIRLAYKNETSASYIYPVTYDSACPVLESVLAQVPGGLTGLGSADPSIIAPLGQITNLTALGGGSEVGY